ncbi:MAG: hypothetical protein AAB509_03370 [Patescibacteria group bacterium]
MLAEIKDFVKRFYDRNFYDIMIFIIVALLVMLSFAVGFILAKYQDKEPIKIEQTN